MRILLETKHDTDADVTLRLICIQRGESKDISIVSFISTSQTRNIKTIIDRQTDRRAHI